MKAVLFLFSIILILSFTSCTKATNDTVSPVTEEETSPSAVPVTVNKTVMLQLVNAVRKQGCQCGDTYYYPVASVTWNSQLETAAYTHSYDMYTNNYFSHTAPNGSNGGARITAAGYDWLAYGENIAMGYKAEKEVVDAWINSPGHCKNLMNGTYKEMGVACVGNYWTQEFASK